MDKKDFILETTVNLRDIKYSENILSKAYYVHLLFYLYWRFHVLLFQKIVDKETNYFNTEDYQGFEVDNSRYEIRVVYIFVNHILDFLLSIFVVEITQRWLRFFSSIFDERTSSLRIW